MLKRNVLLDDFWEETEKVTKLLHPLSTGIQFCEGDIVPLSAIPRILAHIENQLNDENLTLDGWIEEDKQAIIACIASRKKMSIRPVTLAAYNTRSEVS